MGHADMIPDLKIDFGATDLTDCDHEPIRLPASIQPHGALLALDVSDFHIVQGCRFKLEFTRGERP
jgi:light-regulated signal transduction histidine kinase (bacteriophytochrome)